MIWLIVVPVFVVGVFAVVCMVGRESNERPGELRFDTPHARSALRRCNPPRDVHYFGGRDRCECGEVTTAMLDTRHLAAHLGGDDAA